MVWLCVRVRYLAKTPAFFRGSEKRRVLELGAGCGVPGIFCAGRGFKVSIAQHSGSRSRREVGGVALDAGLCLPWIAPCAQLVRLGLWQEVHLTDKEEVLATLRTNVRLATSGPSP